MKRFGNLFSKIVSFENMVLAVKRASRCKKSKDSVARFYLDYEKEVILLQDELLQKTYQPRPYFLFTILEPKERQICSSDFRDRVVHHSICNIIEPILERRLIFDTYACRVGKGSHLAVKRCQTYLRKNKYFLKCDISKYFDSIDHGILKNILSRIFKDQQLIDLLDQIIDHQSPMTPTGKGLPIGNLTSQHFANLYLGELDHFVREHLQVSGYLRYMDDFILFHDSKEHLADCLAKVEAFVETKLALRLKAKATLLAPVTQGAPYLGFRIYPELIRLKRQNLVRMRKKIRQKESQFKKGKISEDDLIRSLNSVYAHAKQANAVALLRKEVSPSLKMA